jgi:predicted nucleotidyltransferase component of viral defense system
MLLQSEILQHAKKEEVPPDTIDKDWVLGHFLAVLFQQSWAQEKLVFKGGTCLKKMLFPGLSFFRRLGFYINRCRFYYYR